MTLGELEAGHDAFSPAEISPEHARHAGKGIEQTRTDVA